MANASRNIDMTRNSSTLVLRSNSLLMVSSAGATIVEAIGAMNAYMAMIIVEIHLRWAGQSRDAVSTALGGVKGKEYTYCVGWLGHSHPMSPDWDLVWALSVDVGMLAVYSKHCGLYPAA